MSESEYIAWGFDHELSAPPGFEYWAALWNDDGPQSAERYARTMAEAKALAETWARSLGLEAVQVDEFGPVRT